MGIIVCFLWIWEVNRTLNADSKCNLSLSSPITATDLALIETFIVSLLGLIPTDRYPRTSQHAFQLPSHVFQSSFQYMHPKHIYFLHKVFGFFSAVLFSPLFLTTGDSDSSLQYCLSTNIILTLFCEHSFPCHFFEVHQSSEQFVSQESAKHLMDSACTNEITSPLGDRV